MNNPVLFKSGLCLLSAMAIAGCGQQTAEMSSPEPQTQHTAPAITLAEVQQLESDHSAHWISAKLVLLPAQSGMADSLVKQENGKLESTTLTPAALPIDIKERHPHLAKFKAYRHNLTTSQVKQWLKQQTFVLSKKADSLSINHLAYTQTGFVLDDLYAAKAELETQFGAHILNNKTQFKLWAPTAEQVEVLVFNADKSPASTAKLTMAEDSNTGVWSAQSDENLDGYYYQYQIGLYHYENAQKETLVTTDPYALSLSTNSHYTQIIDLNDNSTKPEGWDEQQIPPLAKATDNIFYESHVRDFSSKETKLSAPEYRGTYKAFTEQNTDSINHLKALRKAGINSIHLLPVFDIGTINEDKNQVLNLEHTISQLCQKRSNLSVCGLASELQGTALKDYLATLDPITGNAQAIIEEIAQFDNYNWGYDPFHYTVPEGAYAVEPEGKARIIEFREMVKSLHDMDFRVIMDVVYNHTHQAGLSERSVLDKIVPGYYQRLNPLSGEIERSTCCDNTATERTMMSKLMIDSLVIWARDYKIDGFRFDLMAHQPKDEMLKALEAVRAVDPDTYFYGEGWNFGEVANNSQFVQASQWDMAGTGIGTFTDRLRDAIRGGSVSASGDEMRYSQGLGNGLGTHPNDMQNEESEISYKVSIDLARLGLAGNLQDYPLETIDGETKLGKEIDYAGQPAGYALIPADTINYVSKHDNQALWDNNQYRVPYTLGTTERVRMQMQSIAYPLMAQGIPFIHMGSELLRSKSFVRDTYDSSDWFNYVDFSGQSNNYNQGLPLARTDEHNWEIVKTVLKGHEGRDIPNADDIALANKLFQEFVKIRMSSDLFRLETSEEVIKRVKFLNTGKEQQRGLIVMQLDGQGFNGHSPFSSIIVAFNHNPEAVSFNLAQANGYALHPVQKESADPRVKANTAKNGALYIAPLTTAVFVK